MKGIEEAKKFYEEAGAKMLSEKFGDYVGRIAVGLVGRGSECYGYDDDVSRDHDFEVGFSMWLTREDEEKIGFRLMRAYSELKANYGASRAAHSSVMGGGADGVMTIEDFYRRYTATGGAPSSNREWLFTESEFFAEATNGEVFIDDLGEFSKIRNEILTGMPEDVRIKRLAGCAMRMAKSGQYNYLRCVAHNENGAAMMAMSEFVKNAVQMIFLLNRRHCPYYKWMFRALGELPVLGDHKDPLEYLLLSDNDQTGRRVKSEIVEDIAHAISKEIQAQFPIKCEEDYLEPTAFKLNSLIKDAEIRNMHILIG